MRKFLTLLTAVLVTGSLFGGGLVTNTNQSAMFTRLQNRNASTSIDAVYFNPAGLTRLGDGFFASINNQSIFQTKTITSHYTRLTGWPKEYIGDVKAPLFPGIYAAYNKGRLSFSLGFNPVGGGGGAKYNTGLPSFEMGISDIPALLVGKGIPTTQYDADIFFEGSSVYFGYQANIGYKINDKISVAAGVRLVQAKNTYNGYIRDVSVNPNYPAFGAGYTGSMVPATQFFAAGSTFLQGLATTSLSTAATITAAINGGLPATAPLSSLGATAAAGVTQLLGAAGISTAGMNVGTAAATLAGAATGFTNNANAMAAYSGMTEDIDVDAERSGHGFTPIISVNITPMDNLNIALKYEFQTKMNLMTSVKEGMGGPASKPIFVDGEEVPADMPSMFAAGVEYKPMDKLMLAFSFSTYGDKKVDYDGSLTKEVNTIDKNFIEYGLGAEYSLSEKLRISAGWTATLTGVNSNYQSDMTYSTNTNSFGGGLGYRITPKIDFNVGVQITDYKTGTKGFESYWEAYQKSTWLIGAGLDFAIAK